MTIKLNLIESNRIESNLKTDTGIEFKSAPPDESESRTEVQDGHKRVKEQDIFVSSLKPMTILKKEKTKYTAVFENVFL